MVLLLRNLVGTGVVDCGLAVVLHDRGDSRGLAVLQTGKPIGFSLWTKDCAKRRKCFLPAQYPLALLGRIGIGTCGRSHRTCPLHDLYWNSVRLAVL